MKALPMLDHVMLWIARSFTTLLFAFFSLPFVLFVIAVALSTLVFLGFQCLRAADPHLNAVLVPQMKDLFPAPPHALIDPNILAALCLTLLWYASVRLLPSKVARICLGLSSVLFALTAAVLFGAAFGTVISGHGSLLISIFVLILLAGLLGFASMVWVSIRPPSSTPPSRLSRLLAFGHPFPQSRPSC